MRRVTIASLAVAVSLAVPAAATAAGGWSKPKTLLPSGNLVYQPALATAPDGTTVAVWVQYDVSKNLYTLRAAIRTPRGKISMLKLGPAVSALAKPALAVGGDGTFAVAWEYPGTSAGHDSLAVRTMPAGKKAFGPTTKVSGTNLSSDYGSGDQPSVAVDDAGTVFVAWEGLYSGGGGRHTQVVVSERAKRARAWRPAVRLSAAGTDSHGAHIAADGKGNAAVSWNELNTSVWASVTSSAGRFGPAKQIAGVTYGSSPASIAVSDTGKAAILWEQEQGNTHRIAGKVTAPRAFPARTQFLSGKAFSRYQALALASNGVGTGAWEAEVSGGWEIDGATLTGTSWGSAGKLNPTGYAATFGVPPVIAANNQRAIVAWSEKDLHRVSFVGVTVRVGKRWKNTANFPGLSGAIVSVPNDPVRSGPVAGAMVWLSTSGLQISILK